MKKKQIPVQAISAELWDILKNPGTIKKKFYGTKGKKSSKFTICENADTVKIYPIIEISSDVITISRDQFASITQKLLQRIQQPIETTLRDANISPTDLDDVISAFVKVYKYRSELIHV